MEADGITPKNFKHKIIECTPNTSGWGNSVYGKETLVSSQPIEKKVVDSGHCSYSGDYNTGYTMTVTGADTTGSRYPTKRVGGGSLVAGPYFVGSLPMLMMAAIVALLRCSKRH